MGRSLLVPYAILSGRPQATHPLAGPPARSPPGRAGPRPPAVLAPSRAPARWRSAIGPSRTARTLPWRGCSRRYRAPAPVGCPEDSSTRWIRSSVRSMRSLVGRCAHGTPEFRSGFGADGVDTLVGAQNARRGLPPRLWGVARDLVADHEQGRLERPQAVSLGQLAESAFATHFTQDPCRPNVALRPRPGIGVAQCREPQPARRRVAIAVAPPGKPPESKQFRDLAHFLIRAVRSRCSPPQPYEVAHCRPHASVVHRESVEHQRVDLRPP